MRVYVVALALASVACIRSGDRVLDAMDASVQGDVASATRIAASELQGHGYQVTTISPGVVVTLPRPVTEALQQAGDTSAVVGRQWVMQVTATDPRFSTGTHLRVAAFIVPPGTTSARGDTVATTRRGIPVTSANRPLFAEVQQATKWITDAIARQHR